MISFALLLAHAHTAAQECVPQDADLDGWIVAVGVLVLWVCVEAERKVRRHMPARWWR